MGVLCQFKNEQSGPFTSLFSLIIGRFKKTLIIVTEKVDEMIYFFIYENEERVLRFVQEVLFVFRGQSGEQGRSLEGQKVGAEELVGPPGYPDVGERRRVGEGDEALAGELLPGHDALDHVLPV